jgi:predicted Zn-dependent protease with MMP-like domain
MSRRRTPVPAYYLLRELMASRQVRRTVIHEIGHHFGIDDNRLRELGC